jgi:DNA topoisomerase-1
LPTSYRLPIPRLEGDVIGSLRRRAERQLRERLPGLEPEQAAILALLQQRWRRESECDDDGMAA